MSSRMQSLFRTCDICGLYMLLFLPQPGFTGVGIKRVKIEMDSLIIAPSGPLVKRLLPSPLTFVSTDLAVLVSGEGWFYQKTPQ